MINVIGIGHAGCKIADSLSQYPQYTIYKMDVGLKKGKGIFPITQRSSTEEYEEKFSPKVFSDLKKIRGDVLLIVAGGGSISSCTLRVMEALQHNKMEVLLIRPDVSFLTKHATTLDNAVFNVLQEYARSGILRRLFIVSNSEIEKVVGQIPVSSYYEKVNEIISSTFHMFNVCKNSSPSLSSLSEGSETARISTLGIGALDNITDQMFFPLNYISEKEYYFAINQKQLDEDPELLSNLKRRAREEDLTIKVGFGVYPTSYEQNYIYILANTKIIQGVNYDE